MRIYEETESDGGHGERKSGRKKEWYWPKKSNKRDINTVRSNDWVNERKMD